MFRGMLRPGQGFREFWILRRAGGTTRTGRPCTSSYELEGSFFGIITQTSPEGIEQQKQHGSPTKYTIVQHGIKDRASATDVLALDEPVPGGGMVTRYFLVLQQPRNPGGIGHFLTYKVEEREDLQ